MKPERWAALKQRGLDLAELADAWRMAPRGFVAFYLFQLERVTTWYIALPVPTTQQASFVAAVWGFLMPVFGFYVSTGRKWTT